ncbi:MAG: hypothetical protein BZY81_07035 [SAR202 cluster bacterium Io17-Chloro-G4]|nr:MAG: hypothetical protein BZY81_07035 [SAR202 cluster bacterium Io17-Chloro-G4]
MFLEFSEGTFLWQWFHSWAGLNAMAVALVIGFLAICVTKWNFSRIMIKLIIAGGAVATLPLGLSNIGIDIWVIEQIPELSDQAVANLSLFGAAVVGVIGVPYLMGQTILSSSGKSSSNRGRSDRNRLGNGFNGATSEHNTLSFGAGPRKGETMEIGMGTMTVGRSPDNDIVIDDPTVSRRHARITFDGNQFNIEDLNSSSGTRVNGKSVTRGEGIAGANIKLGNTEICFNRKAGYREKFPPIGVGDSGETRVIAEPADGVAWLAVSGGPGIGQTHRLISGNNTIGRESGNDVSQNDSYMSSRHALLKIVDSHAYVYDLGSTGGTKINGKEIGGRQIEPNSVISVGETELHLLQVDNPKQFANATMSGNTMAERRGEQVGVLLVKSRADAGKSFMLTQGDNIIGRGSGCSIGLSDDSVSRQHAVIRYQGGKMVLFDIGSRGGTKLNGQAIGGHLVRPGDVISMGRSEFTMMAQTPAQ